MGANLARPVVLSGEEKAFCQSKDESVIAFFLLKSYDTLTLQCILKGSFSSVSENGNSRNVPRGRYVCQVGPLGISQIIPPTHRACLMCR